MNLLRLKIQRSGFGSIAVGEGQQTFPIVNPGDIPAGMEDGIFSIDPVNKVAKFESRKSDVPYVSLNRKEFKDTPPATVTTLSNRTSMVFILDRKVVLTRTDTGVIVDAPDLSKDVAKFVAALVLAGYDAQDPRLAEALRYVLDK